MNPNTPASRDAVGRSQNAMGRTRNAMARRTFLKGVAGTAAAASTLAVASSPAAAQSAFDGWFDNVSNYDGVVDMTGNSEVEIEVGSTGNNGAFGFGPAAVRVDPGTNVVWTWTGEGGSHNVVAEDGSFESEMVGDEGHTFEQTFEENGITKYACTPHKPMGMKGAVVVGDEAATEEVSSESNDSDGSEGSGTESGFGDWFDNVSNYDGVVDLTGQSVVAIDVGAEGNDGAFGFGPAAVRVDPGATVIWTWTGEGGSHNVVAEDGSFESELVGDAGHTFEKTFDEEGVFKYACTPHKPMGMKGAVVVGDEAATGASSVEPSEAAAQTGGLKTSDYLTVGFAGALVTALFGLPIADARKKRKDKS